MKFDLLDGYESDLAVVLAPLPDEKRAQVLAEVRAHLEAMIEARRADGINAERALENALEGFGSSEQIGRELLDEWARGPRMEVRGTPLSKREKLKLLGRPFVFVLIYYPLVTWILPQYVDETKLDLLFSIVAMLCFAFGGWRWLRERNGKLSAAQKSLFAVCTFQALMSIIYLNRRLMPFDVDRYFANYLWISLPLLIGSLVWCQRERKTNPPWRTLKTYQANPIATEERFRLSGLIGLIMGATMGVMSMLWMSWNFYGLIYGIGSSIVLLAIYGLLYRWIR